MHNNTYALPPNLQSERMRLRRAPNYKRKYDHIIITRATNTGPRVRTTRKNTAEIEKTDLQAKTDPENDRTWDRTTDTLGDNRQRGNEDAILQNMWDLSFISRNQTKQHPKTTMEQQENEQTAPKLTDQDTDMDIDNNLKPFPHTLGSAIKSSNNRM